MSAQPIPFDAFYYEKRESQHVVSALLLSLCLHIAAVVLMSLYWSQSPDTADEKRVVVKLVQEKPEKRQIVTPTKQPSQEPSVETPLRAEVSSRADTQMIRRGDEASVDIERPIQETPNAKSTVAQNVPEKVQQAKTQSKSVSKDRPKPNTTREPILSLTPGEMARSLENATPSKTENQKQEVTRLRPQADYTPFRSAVSAPVSGRIGSADYLPTIQDGDITLLNAKADKYAVFVRRVALQVFGILRKLSWSKLTPRQIGQLQEFTEVRATLNADGTLRSVSLGASSGVSEFDSLLLAAGRQGAWDKNPPPGAQLPDGTIVFVFRSKTWSRALPSGLGEQRWLLLSAGLL